MAASQFCTIGLCPLSKRLTPHEPESGFSQQFSRRIIMHLDKWCLHAAAKRGGWRRRPQSVHRWRPYERLSRPVSFKTAAQQPQQLSPHSRCAPSRRGWGQHFALLVIGTTLPGWHIEQIDLFLSSAAPVPLHDKLASHTSLTLHVEP